MKKKSLSVRDILFLVILLVLLIGVVYYMAFLTPLKADLTKIANQSAALDTQIMTADAKIASMDKMQAELDEIHSRPANEVTEVAPYDNAKVVMNDLNGILSQSLEYKLTFSDPKIDNNGIVRRTVNMSFRCEDYASAIKIIDDLSSSHWRCLLTNVSVDGGEDINEGEVVVGATITFFESTNLT